MRNATDIWTFFHTMLMQHEKSFFFFNICFLLHYITQAKIFKVVRQLAINS